MAPVSRGNRGGYTNGAQSPVMKKKTSKAEKTREKKEKEKAALYLTDLIEAFWEGELDDEQCDKLAAFLRTCLPEIPSDVSSAVVIGQLKRNFFTGESFSYLIYPYCCQMVYDGSYKAHPFGKELITKFEPDTFAGCPPKDHPAPHVFANEKLHVYLPEYGKHRDKHHMTFRFAETGKNLCKDDNFGHDEWQATKNFALMLLVDGKDVGIYKNGKKLPHPGAEVVEEARAILKK